MMEGRKIESAVISGASGMIGAALTERLLKEGIAVTAIVRPGSEKVRNLPAGAAGLRILYADLRALYELPGLSCDAFFHFGWNGTYGAARQDEALQEANVAYTLQLIRKAKESGACLFFGAGSQAEYGRFEGKLREDTPMHPENAYGKAKKLAEDSGRALAAELGIDFIWARILSVYGPYDNSYTMIMQAIEALLKGERPSFTAGEQHWDYLYQDDAAEAIYGMARFGRSGESYVLGSGEDRLLREYILDLRDAVDPKLQVGLGERPYPEGQVMYLSADITKLTRDTGFLPKTSFRDGIERTVSHVRGRSI